MLFAAASALARVIYGLVDPREPDRVRYVGKAFCAASRFGQHIESAVDGPLSNPRAAWIAGLIKDGVGPSMVLLEQGSPHSRGRELHWFTTLRAVGQADLNIHAPQNVHDFGAQRRRHLRDVLFPGWLEARYAEKPARLAIVDRAMDAIEAKALLPAKRDRKEKEGSEKKGGR